MAGTDQQQKPDVAVKEKVRVDKPRLYKVLLHNDNYTTMEFVVHILQTVFRKSTQGAIEIMLNVHHIGIGVCGVYPHAVAETKADRVHEMAAQEGFPLRCTVEPE